MHRKVSDSVLTVYDDLERLLCQSGLSYVLEPREHVMVVERLRQQYRPHNTVRFLVIAESHVRVSQASFQTFGPRFIYNTKYYTPWWRHLLLPAFAPSEKIATPEVRKRLLDDFRSSGVWILDASLIAMSGYKKVDPTWKNRPLDTLRGEIMALCWRGHMQSQLLKVMNQRSAPVVCAVQSVKNLLPELLHTSCMTINLVTPSNSRVYSGDDYRFGTQAFIRAVRKAGL